MKKIISLITLMIMMTTILNAQQNDLASLNDEFNNEGSLNSWKAHHEVENWPDFTNKAETREDESVFYIEPKTSGWYGDFHRGPYYFKEISGDFTVSTKIKVTGLNTPSPERGFSLAGLMIRTPRPANASKHAKKKENWLFLSTGSAKKKGKAEFESKNTINGKSKLKVFPAKAGWVHLAISRVGNTFYQSYRYEGETNWTLLRTIKRDDMPEKIQVGMLAYTDFWPLLKWFIFNSAKKFNTKAVKGKPDLIARFDYVHFTRLSDSYSLNTDEGFNQLTLSEEQKELLALK